MAGKYIMILFDRESNGQITSSFNDINSIDQAKDGVVRAMKKWQEEHPVKKGIDWSNTTPEEVLSKIKWVDSKDGS